MPLLPLPPPHRQPAKTTSRTLGDAAVRRTRTKQQFGALEVLISFTHQPVLCATMASITHTSEPDIPDNHRDSWLALLSAAEVYCQKSGCDLAILTACRKFRPSDADGRRKQESGGGGASFPKECDFLYSVWGQSFLAESARRYVDDIGVLHSTTMLMAQRHTRQAGGGEGGAKLDLTSESGLRGVGVFMSRVPPAPPLHL